MFGYLQFLQRWFYAVKPMMDMEEENNSTVSTVDSTINTMVDDVDEKNNSSLNTVNPISTTMDDVDQKESSTNARIDISSPTTEDDELIEGIASLALQSTATHLQQVLRLYWGTGIEDLMKPGDVQSGWSMINTLASFAVSNANLQKRHDEKLLPSAIMRIAFDIFASRDQLEKPLNSETIERLLGKESEYVPVALELLDWILSGEIISPELTEEMQDGFGFDFLAALKSRYLESTAEEAENITQSGASISYDVVIDEVRTGMSELEEAGVHALLALDSSTAGIDELIRRIASLSLGSTAEEAENIIQSDASISYDTEIDTMRTGMAELEEADVHALLVSGLDELPIHKEIKQVVMISREILG